MNTPPFNPLPGQLYQHTETGHRATFQYMRHGLMVLESKQWGECRWAPERTRLITLAWRKSENECKNGHELTEANRAPRSGGGFTCRTCKNALQRINRSPGARMREAAR